MVQRGWRFSTSEKAVCEGSSAVTASQFTVLYLYRHTDYFSEVIRVLNLGNSRYAPELAECLNAFNLASEILLL